MCGLVDRYPWFQRNLLLPSSMYGVSACSSEALVPSVKPRRCHITDDSNTDTEGSQNLKYRSVNLSLICFRTTYHMSVVNDLLVIASNSIAKYEFQAAVMFLL
jgi:hypothetical protein